MHQTKVSVRNKKAIIIFLLVIATSCSMLMLTGCTDKVEKANANKLHIVATTTMLSDLVSIIGGDKVEVSSLMGPGIDPHLYQASAGDVSKMQKADVVVYNGLHLEGKMGKIFASLAEQNRTVICAEDGLNEADLLNDEDNPEIHDPHIWFDVSIWKDVARHVAGSLSEIDGKNADKYAANLSAYLVELDKLQAYIKTRIAELPENQRVLVTAHDAFRYFGKAYNFQVMGLQGISTDAEAGTADVSSLADFIAKNKIKAIFIESSVPPKNIEALQAAVAARGFAVQIGGELYSDSLGDAGSGHESYLGTLKANIDTIIDALL